MNGMSEETRKTIFEVNVDTGLDSFFEALGEVAYILDSLNHQVPGQHIAEIVGWSFMQIINLKRLYPALEPQGRKQDSMNAKQAYAETYRLYRVLAAMPAPSKHNTFSETIQGAMVETNIQRQHAANPRIAAAAHTSFSMRALFNR